MSLAGVSISSDDCETGASKMLTIKIPCNLKYEKIKSHISTGNIKFISRGSFLLKGLSPRLIWVHNEGRNAMILQLMKS